MLFLKIILILLFGCILYEDLKYRAVHWFLFPLVGVCIGLLFFLNTLPELFLVSVLNNLVFISILFGVIFLYAQLKLKTGIGQVIGLGDILLIMVLVFGCATVSFIVLLTCAFIFALILHLFLSKKQKTVTVPLAGYISLFFGIAFIGSWAGLINSLYLI
ncbi:general secretion pathway protein [Seonamhaeicola sp.]|uniref:general secretion pathway protein n=1 Tax=Seonamhaeicola sp. TaxID=1912245 RepID=UPI0026039DD3|nr:general secretion pathway protein [Seonamhaeicola sp.]